MDAFAELGFERRPWLDPQEIKTHYHQLAASAHPDQISGAEESLTRFNDARRILESPSHRLRHLVNILFPDFHPSEKANPDWDLFSNVGSLRKRIGELAEKKEKASSALSRAIATNELSKMREELEMLELRVTAAAHAIEEKIKAADRTRAKTNPAVLWQLAEEWTFCSRCNDALHEARIRLEGG